jgi:DNA replication protein DnaC
MPTIGRSWEDLAAQARDDNWSHEEYLAALLQRQVADRESAGSIMRIRTAHFPAMKTLEDFNLDHLPSLAATSLPTWPSAHSSRKRTT